MKNVYFPGLLLILLTAPAVRSAENLAQLNVFPNPVKRVLGHNTLTFDNITPQAKIKIYTVNGTLVREVQLSGGGNSYQWDLRNSSSQEVASGIYVYIITNDAGEKRTGKIAIIR